MVKKILLAFVFVSLTTQTMQTPHKNETGGSHEQKNFKRALVLTSCFIGSELISFLGSAYYKYHYCNKLDDACTEDCGASVNNLNLVGTIAITGACATYLYNRISRTRANQLHISEYYDC